MRGHKRDEYLCPITNEWCEFGENKNIIYCCYPNQVNEVIKEQSPGYESQVLWL